MSDLDALLVLLLPGSEQAQARGCVCEDVEHIDSSCPLHGRFA